MSSVPLSNLRSPGGYGKVNQEIMGNQSNDNKTHPAPSCVYVQTKKQGYNSQQQSFASRLPPRWVIANMIPAVS